MLTIQVDKTPIVSAAATPLNTPLSPIIINKVIQHHQHSIKKNYFVEQSIRNAGYIPLKRIDKTLQGSVWKVTNGKGVYVMKVTNKMLHRKRITKQNGQEIHIKENIIKEKTILKYLTSYDPPESLAKYIRFFMDKYNYFLVMEYAGQMSLFEFVKICHQYIKEGILDITEWHKFCKMAFKQMVELLHWMHNTMHTCHLDLSLENFVIDHVMVIQENNSNKITFSSEFQIKIIDFGVSEVFFKRDSCNNIDFNYKKSVGKTLYKAPNVYAKKSFDARAADMWSLGVVFFIMLIGVPPFIKPVNKDPSFLMIVNGNLKTVLIEWNRLEYVTPKILSLLNSLLQKEKYRLTIKDIKIHPFLL